MVNIHLLLLTTLLFRITLAAPTPPFGGNASASGSGRNVSQKSTKSPHGVHDLYSHRATPPLDDADTDTEFETSTSHIKPFEEGTKVTLHGDRDFDPYGGTRNYPKPHPAYDKGPAPEQNSYIVDPNRPRSPPTPLPEHVRPGDVMFLSSRHVNGAPAGGYPNMVHPFIVSGPAPQPDYAEGYLGSHNPSQNTRNTNKKAGQGNSEPSIEVNLRENDPNGPTRVLPQLHRVPYGMLSKMNPAFHASPEDLAMLDKATKTYEEKLKLRSDARHEQNDAYRANNKLAGTWEDVSQVSVGMMAKTAAGYAADHIKRSKGHQTDRDNLNLRWDHHPESTQASIANARESIEYTKVSKKRGEDMLKQRNP